jgi:hypothetical protein
VSDLRTLPTTGASAVATAPTVAPIDEAAYWQLDEGLRAAHIALAEAGAARERAWLLGKLAEYELASARAHPHLFGPDPLEDEGGRDLSESMGWSATLYRLLADVERVVAVNYVHIGQYGDGEPMYSRIGREVRREVGTLLEAEAGPILNRMSHTPDLAERVKLLEDLADAVADLVGAQALETLWCLPSPGYSGWLTVAEKDAWWRTAGYGDGMESFSRRMITSRSHCYAASSRSSWRSAPSWPYSGANPACGRSPRSSSPSRRSCTAGAGCDCAASAGSSRDEPTLAPTRACRRLRSPSIPDPRIRRGVCRV